MLRRHPNECRKAVASVITTTQQVCKNSPFGFGQKCTTQQVKKDAYACTLYRALQGGNPATWKTAPSSNSYCGYLTGTSSYSTSINQVTWNLAGQATQLGSTGLSLATCAQLCLSSAGCFAWTWTLVSGSTSPSTCYQLGFITGATASTNLPAGVALVISSSVSTLTPGTALTGGSPPYSTPNGRTAMLCLAACVADANCAGG